VSQWSAQEKLIAALKRAGKYLPVEGLARLQELLSPEALEALAAGLLIWGASHAIGFGWVADGGLLIAGTIFLGMDVWRGGAELGKFLQGALGAQSEADLDAAGQHFAAGFTILGVDVLLAFAARFKPVKDGGQAVVPEHTALTPQGIRLPVPPVAEPAPSALERVVKAFKKTGSGASGRAPNHPTLRVNEGKVGTFGELDDPTGLVGRKGDNLTPHHIPNHAYMDAQHIPGYTRDEGISIMMDQRSPGRGGRHRQTSSYGTQPDLTRTPRQTLAHEIWDARKIYKQDGLYTPEIRQGLLEVIRLNKNKWPFFGKLSKS
jgi:filamentous hemagglutinin